MTIDSTNSALLIVAHGSTAKPDSSAPTLAHAAEIGVGDFSRMWGARSGRRNRACAIRLFLFDPKTIREVCVVPNFISEGYFTQTVSRASWSWTRATTNRANGQIWKYCEPVGNHPTMTELLLKRGREIAPGVDPTETSLLIVAHGTDLNENSAVAAEREAERSVHLGGRGRVERVHGRAAARVRSAETDENPERGRGTVFHLRRIAQSRGHTAIDRDRCSRGR